MTEPLIQGWGHIPSVSRKWHWFKPDGRSLCGRVLALRCSYEDGNDNSPDNCAECRRRKAKQALAADPDDITVSRTTGSG